MAFLIGGANSAVSVYDIDNSWRGNGSNSYFNRTLETPTSRRIWTFSAWTKRVPGTDSNLISFGPTAQLNDLRFNADDKLAWHIDDAVNGTSTEISPVFRDPSAWYHIVLAVDTTQGTAANRAKFYVNGTQITDFDSAIYPAEDYDFPGLLADQVTQVGTRTGNDFGYTTGYLADVAFVDGTQLTPSSFGETDEDSGIWKPIKPSPTWGNSGFFLEFNGTGTSADASGKGADTSGNGNHFDDNNADVYDITTDTPTNNFCTMNPLANAMGGTLAEGNLKLTGAAATDKHTFSTFGLTSGKWYFECRDTDQGARGEVGVTDVDHGLTAVGTNYAHIALHSGGVSSSGTVNSNVGSGFSDNDILCVALDLDNGNVWFSEDADIDISGTANVTGLATSGLDREYRINCRETGNPATIYELNFGNAPYAISSGNADANGYGNFEHAVPSGYFALCTKNLAEHG